MCDLCVPFVGILREPLRLGVAAPPRMAKSCRCPQFTIRDTLELLGQFGLPESKAIAFIAAQWGVSATAVREQIRYKTRDPDHPKL